MRRTLTIVTLVALAGGLAGAGLLGQANPQVELRTAIELEKAKGQTQAAIEIYKRLAAGADPKVASAAKEALARLGAAPAKTSAGSLTLRKVWSGSANDVDPGISGLSPDGRFLSFVHWANGNLAVRDMASGEIRDVTKDGGYSPCSRYAWESVWSPMGKEIAYHWLNCDEEPPHHSLRIIRADGSAMRVVLRTPDVNWPAPAAWTPDGSHIVLLAGRTDRTWQIGLVSVSDGSYRVLKTLDWRKPGRVSLSPDGKYLAYDLARNPTDDRRDILVLAIDGRQEVRVVEHVANDSLPVWTPAGDQLMFLSDRSGTEALWQLNITAGRPSGEPRLAGENAGGWPIGFTPDGTFYYAARAGNSNILTAGFDPKAAVLTNEPTLAVTTFVGRNLLPAWSPDGRSLAYLSMRSQRQATPGYMRATLVIRDVTRGTERTLTPKVEFCSQCGIRWSPDGRQLAVRAIDDKGRSGIHTIDLSTSEVSPLVVDAGRRWWAEWLPDGQSIMFQRAPQGQTSPRIFLRDLETGTERVIADGELVGMSAVSPDGRTLAYARTIGTTVENWKRELALVPLAGGQSRSLTGLMDIRGGYWWDPRFIQWTPDGRYLLFGRRTDRPEGSELWKVAVEDGRPELLTVLPSNRVCDLRLSPDGRQVVFDDCSDGTLELWEVKNLLTPARRR